MPVSVSSIPAVPERAPEQEYGTVDDRQRRLLVDLVVAGPGAAGRCGAGLLGQIVPVEAIEAALAQAGHVDQRERTLTGPVTALVLLNLALFSGEGYDSVLARTFAAMPGLLAPGRGVPSGSALSQARARLDDTAMRLLFEHTAAAGVQDLPQARRDRLFGLEVTAFDGTSVDLSHKGGVASEFAIPGGGRYPKARIVTLTQCATRRVRAAAVDSYGVAEQPLCDRLADALGPGMLNLADRNFFSMARWIRFAATGAHLIWRVKNGKRSLPAKVLRRLSDGSCLVVLRESAAMLSRRRRATGDKTLPRLPDALARLVEFDLVTQDAYGKTTTSRLRLLTMLLDPQAAPATQIAGAYAERWQAELAYYRLKCTLRGSDVVLRGQTPALARQEIWALLIVYNALCDLAARVAALDSVDPDEISFIAVVRRTRTHLATDTRCERCGHRSSDTDQAMNALLSDIAAHPRNRIGRNRTGPRTAAQKKTRRASTATYTITIVESTLHKPA